MALITRCPHCATAFRVTPLNLQVHGGDVRCGHCARIFNGFASLATIQEPEAVTLSTAAISDTSPDTSETAVAKKQSQKQPSPADASDEEVPAHAPSQKKIQQDVITQPDVLDKPATLKVPDPIPAKAEEPSRQKWETTDAPDAAIGLEDSAPENYAFDEAQPHKTSYTWALGSLILLAILVAQAIYFYRAELSVIAPGIKPYLEQGCKLLGCTIAPPRNSELLSIESSEMQADTQHSGVITLTATVRNYAPYPQTFPLFELTLIDLQDRPLASRIFASDTYFEKNLSSSGVVAPNYEFNVRLYLDSGNLNAAGYRLLLFYPAA
ncbi:MAG: zinc-ribbon and DUF3426 domain-containing protein [Nitrosospira sp.]